MTNTENKTDYSPMDWTSLSLSEIQQMREQQHRLYAGEITIDDFNTSRPSYKKGKRKRDKETEEFNQFLREEAIKYGISRK